MRGDQGGAVRANYRGTTLVAYIGHQLGGTLSAWLGGWAYERYGTHWIAFGAAGVLLLGAGLVSLQLPRKGFTLMAAPAAS